MRKIWIFKQIPVILLLPLFLLTGCIQPAAVHQSTLNTQEESAETPQAQTADSANAASEETPEPALLAQEEQQAPEPVMIVPEVESTQQQVLVISEETAEVKAANDDIELPEDALPAEGETIPLIILDEEGLQGSQEMLPLAPEEAEAPFIPSEGPLEPGKEPVHLIEGWRVQIASLKSQDSALDLADTLKNKISYSPHIVWRDGAYKIQVGDFPDIQSANSYKDSLRVIGYKEAFVVTGHVKTIGGEPDSLATRGREVAHPALLKPVDGWRIQIMSLNDRSAAHKEAGIARSKLGYTVYIEESNGIFKLRVGDFLDKEKADAARDEFIINGYSGAFPVATKVKLRSRRY